MFYRPPIMLALLMVFALSLSACAGKQNKPTEKGTPKQVESHYLLGLDALNKNNLPKAFDELLHAERLDPRRADILDALGYAWLRRGDLQKSHAYYTRAIAIEPSPGIYNNFGILLLTMEKPKEAEKAFKKALDDPRYNNPDIAYINLGDALLMQDRLNDAIAAYRQARLLNPLPELSRLKEASAYVKYDRPAFAKAMYETILRDSPANRQALQGLLPLLETQGETGQIREQLRTFIKQTPEPLDRAWAEEQLTGMQP